MKKVSINNFVELLYAKLSKHEIFYINVEEISHAIRIIKESPNFAKYSNVIDGETFTISELKKIPYTKKVSPFGEVKFDISSSEAEKIIKENDELEEVCDNLIDFMATCKQINIESEQVAYCNIKSPNDSYDIRYKNSGETKSETMIFTDGDVSIGYIYSDECEPLTKVRNLTISNASFSFFVTCMNNDVTEIEVRNYDIAANSIYIMDEVENICLGRVGHYKKLTTNPRVYKSYKN